jgi:hypothetical protein
LEEQDMDRATRTLRIESLEQKQMLAGDVTVSVLNGVLTLQGDDLDNQVAVSAGETAGSFVIHGLDGTQLILGDAAGAAELVVEGVRRGLVANLGNGNDVLRINEASFRGNVAINMGEGDDRVSIGVAPEVSEASLTVDADAELDLPSVQIGQSLLIRTGAGNDTVVINDTRGRGSLGVSTGEGDDTVRLGLASEGEEAELDDEVLVSFAHGVALDLGAGADDLFVNQLRAGVFHANGGAGADTMRINDVKTHVMNISGGRGEEADSVVLNDVATRLLTVHLGAGDDSLTLSGVKAQFALLQGGRGEADTLTLLGENLIRHRRVAGFEVINPSEPAAE